MGADDVPGAPILSADASAVLWALARDSVRAAVKGGALPELPAGTELSTRAGVFVSLHREGALRGCLGNLEASFPLAEITQRMAVAATRDDPRFPPVAPEELEGLQVEVSVLTPLIRATADELVAGRDGVLVRRGGRQGVLLPQVATEMGWTVPQLLSGACRKAGLPEDAWKDPRTELFSFRTQVVTDSGAP